MDMNKPFSDITIPLSEVHPTRGTLCAVMVEAVLTGLSISFITSRLVRRLPAFSPESVGLRRVITALDLSIKNFLWRRLAVPAGKDNQVIAVVPDPKTSDPPRIS
jgi:hypothetical protein